MRKGMREEAEGRFEKALERVWRDGSTFLLGRWPRERREGTSFGGWRSGLEE
jgi:hypothetical protein